MALVPAVRALCLRYSFVDFPGPLKIHSRPMPRLGGVAIAMSFAVGMLIASRNNRGGVALAFAALGVVWLAGLFDDLRTLSPYARLVAQIASGIILWAGGYRFLCGNILPATGAIGLILVCTLVVVFTNTFNFLDGSDGLATGVAAIAGAAFLLITRGAAPGRSPLVAACLAGSCSAFLFYNWAPASIYLGDCGSTFIGLCVALLALSPSQAARASSPVAIVLLTIAALPVADFALAVFRRLRSRRSPLQGDRSHIYDVMLARGWTPRAIALFFYAITVALSAAAWLSLWFGLLGSLWILTASMAGIIALVISLGALRGNNREIRLDRRGKFAPPE